MPGAGSSVGPWRGGSERHAGREGRRCAGKGECHSASGTVTVGGWLVTRHCHTPPRSSRDPSAPHGLCAAGQADSLTGRLWLTGVSSGQGQGWGGRALGIAPGGLSTLPSPRYKYNWKLEEARKNLLRTHTTAASARALYRLAQKVWGWLAGQGAGREGHGPAVLAHLLTFPRFLPTLQKPFTPVKYFSIDRVFRNETLDATHLAEFHQIEGVVADHGLHLGHLMGILREFFTKLGEWVGPQAGACGLGGVGGQELEAGERGG